MTPFETFEETRRTRGLNQALEYLCDYLVEQKRFHELFELRKVQLRLQLGLPVEQWQSIEELPADKGQALEEGLLGICREVGTMLMRDGDFVSGWSYLEPVGDKQTARQLLGNIEVTNENVEALVHLCITRGVDPARGFQLVLDRFGTCAAITALETQLGNAPLEIRRETTGLLVRHVYQELCRNIERSLDETTDLTDRSFSAGHLQEIMQAHPDLTAGLSHHIDTTHLASTIRYSQILIDPPTIDLAIELAIYGTGLHEDFQYRGTAPFSATYRDTLEFLRAMGDGNPGVDSVIERLRKLAGEQRDELKVLDSAAWFVYFLDRLGRGEDAIDAWLTYLHEVDDESVINEDIAPSLQQLASRYQLHDRVAKTLTGRGDLLGFATVMSSREQLVGK